MNLMKLAVSPDGKIIFYKLQEHLATYYKTWSEHCQEMQTMLASQPQRQPHEKRIWSTNYVSHVLPPAKWHQPGISNNQIETILLAAEEIVVAQNVSLVEGTETTFVIQDVAMQDMVAPPSELTTHDVTMQDAVVHTSFWAIFNGWELKWYKYETICISSSTIKSVFHPRRLCCLGGCREGSKALMHDLCWGWLWWTKL